MMELAERNGVRDKIPYKHLDEVRAAHNYHNLESFLTLYYAGCAVLLTKQVMILPSKEESTQCVVPY